MCGKLQDLFSMIQNQSLLKEDGAKLDVYQHKDEACITHAFSLRRSYFRHLEFIIDDLRTKVKGARL